MTITIDTYTLAGVLAVLLAYPPIFRQVRDAILTTWRILAWMKRFTLSDIYADVNLTKAQVHSLELWRDDHDSAVGLHNEMGQR